MSCSHGSVLFAVHGFLAASVSTATAVKPGFFSHWGKANLRSFMVRGQGSLFLRRGFSFLQTHQSRDLAASAFRALIVNSSGRSKYLDAEGISSTRLWSARISPQLITRRPASSITLT